MSEKIRNNRIISPNYSDRHAADELRKEMLRYSRDKQSCFISICDFASWLFTCHLGQAKTAAMVEREKTEATNAYADPVLKYSDQKSLLNWLSWRFLKEGWGGVAIIIDNYAVAQYGELDEENYTTKAEREAAQKALKERFKKESGEARELRKWLETPSALVSATGGKKDGK